MILKRKTPVDNWEQTFGWTPAEAMEDTAPDACSAHIDTAFLFLPVCLDEWSENPRIVNIRGGRKRVFVVE